MTAVEFAGPLPEQISAIRRALVDLDARRAELAAARDVDGLAFGVAGLAELIGDLGVIQRSARLDIAGVLIEEETDPKARPKRYVEGLGIVEVPGGMERKNWESKRLLRRLVMDLVVDSATGEQVPYDSTLEFAEAVLAMLEEVLPLGGWLSWKVGSYDRAKRIYSGLRGRGIDPAEWCDEGEKERIAQVPKRRGVS